MNDFNEKGDIKKRAEAKETKIVCPACKRKINSTSRFCTYCGAPVKRFCRKCGAVISSGHRFCSKCGAKADFGEYEAEGKGAEVGGKPKILAAAVIFAVVLAVAVVISCIISISSSEKKGYYTASGGYNESDEDSAAAEIISEESTQEAEESSEDIYQQAMELYGNKNYDEAVLYFGKISGYKDADYYAESCNTMIIMRSCKQEYINYINEVINADSINKNNEFAFIYVDDDEIPELFVRGTYMAYGDTVCIYYDGTFYEYQLYRMGGMSYIEREGLVSNTNENQGYFTTQIYTLSKGILTEIATGDTNSNDPVDEMDIFKWEGEPVSEEEYKRQLNAVYDTSKAKSITDTFTASEVIAYLNANY
ncbi:MAG: zinc ribbon domain-containing protein [Eubacterium sp.]|nr:zinc ribbon domain-containing protein [Eubacterium sp.]